MNEIIRKRKSVRKIDISHLDSPTLEKVRAQIYNCAPLYPRIQYTVDVANKIKGLSGVKAPHYLIFRSEEWERAHENIGFVGQQMDLFFAELGLGSCWLGMGKPGMKDDGALPFVILSAKTIGSAMPLLAKKVGFDPAVMSSPFITTIVDAISLIIYFRIASTVLGL